MSIRPVKQLIISKPTLEPEVWCRVPSGTLLFLGFDGHLNFINSSTPHTLVHRCNRPKRLFATTNLADGSTSYSSDADPSAGLVTSATAASPVPEPTSLALVGNGSAAIAAEMRRRHWD